MHQYKAEQRVFLHGLYSPGQIADIFDEHFDCLCVIMPKKTAKPPRSTIQKNVESLTWVYKRKRKNTLLEVQVYSNHFSIRTRGDEPTGDRRDKDAAARPTSISPYTSEEEDTSDVSPEPRRRNKRRRRGSDGDSDSGGSSIEIEEEWSEYSN